MWKAFFIGLVLSASVFSLSGTKQDRLGDTFEYEAPPTLKLILVYLQEQEKKEAAEKRENVSREVDRFLASGLHADTTDNIV